MAFAYNSTASAGGITVTIPDAPGIGGAVGPAHTCISAITGYVTLNAASGTVTISYVDAEDASQTHFILAVSNGVASALRIPINLTNLNLNIFGNTVTVAVGGAAASAHALTVIYDHQYTD